VVAPYPNINIIISLTNLVLILNWRFFKAAKMATALQLVKNDTTPHVLSVIDWSNCFLCEQITDEKLTNLVVLSIKH
jgi:hypothetical protein